MRAPVAALGRPLPDPSASFFLFRPRLKSRRCLHSTTDYLELENPNACTVHRGNNRSTRTQCVRGLFDRRRRACRLRCIVSGDTAVTFSCRRTGMRLAYERHEPVRLGAHPDTTKDVSGKARPGSSALGYLYGKTPVLIQINTLITICYKEFRRASGDKIDLRLARKPIMPRSAFPGGAQNRSEFSGSFALAGRFLATNRSQDIMVCQLRRRTALHV